MVEQEALLSRRLQTEVPRSILTSGDFVFNLEIEGEAQEFRVSPQGAKLIAKGVDLIGLFAKSYDPDYFKDGYHVYYGRSAKAIKDVLADKEVAVKNINPNEDLSGLELFKAIRVLEDAGVRVASPLIAGETRMISLWIAKCKVNRSREASFAFPEFFWRVDSITKALAKMPSLEDPQKPMWQDNWFLDSMRHNYAVGDLDAKKLRDRFIAIDPVTYREVPKGDLWSIDVEPY